MEKTAFLNREAVTASQEGTRAVELFLMSHYRFRRNILNGKVEFAQLPEAAEAAEGHTAGTADSLSSASDEARLEYRPLTQAALKSIVIRATTLQNTIGNKVRLGRAIKALGFQHKEHAHVAFYEVVSLRAA